MAQPSVNTQLEHLQSKYVGTGHADTNKYEWVVNQHRDSYASYIGHHNLVSYFSVAENESIGRMKLNFLEVRRLCDRVAVLDLRIDAFYNH